MEKEKYYTPSIEEFHVGFEYEKFDERVAMYSNYPKGCDVTNWHRFKYDLKSIRLSQIGTHLYNKTIRVKYLDREDIESFGLSAWNDTDINIYFNNQYKTIIYRGSEVNLSCVYNKRSNWLCVVIEDKYIEKSTSNTIFAGYIKNKSEFSRLLKQLSII